MLRFALAALMIVACVFAGDNALAQKSARITVNPDGSRTIVYRESGNYVVPASVYHESYYQSSYGYRVGYQISQFTHGWLRPYTKTWTDTLPAPRKAKPRPSVERSIVIHKCKECGQKLDWRKMKFHNER